MSLLPLLSEAQNKTIRELNDLDILGSNGENLIISEKESFKAQNYFSEFYVDSITLIPFTGLIIIDYNGHYKDSINVQNGLKNGLCLNYMTADTVVKLNMDYYDQSESIFIARSFPYSTKKHTKKNKYNYIWIRFYSNQNYIRIHCVEKKNNWHVTIYENDKKSKCEISTLGEIYPIVDRYKTNVDLTELLKKIKAID